MGEKLRDKTLRIARQYGFMFETFTAKQLAEYIGDTAGRRYQPHKNNVSALLSASNEFEPIGPAKKKLWTLRNRS